MDWADFGDSILHRLQEGGALRSIDEIRWYDFRTPGQSHALSRSVMVVGSCVCRRGGGQSFLAPMRTHLRAANCKPPSYGSPLPTTATSLAFTRSGDPEAGRDCGRQ